MPNRILREDILDSDPINSLVPEAELFYRRLMSVVDDHGRYDGRPTILLAKLYPLQMDRVTATCIGIWKKACEDAEVIRCYEVAGKPYVVLLNFGQRLQAASKWPLPPWEDGVPELPESRPEPAAAETKASTANRLPLPENLKTPAFRAAWEEWRLYRAESKWGAMNSYTAKQFIGKCEKWGSDLSVKYIRRAIQKEFKTILADEELNYGPGGKPAPPAPKPRPPEPPPPWLEDAKAVADHLSGKKKLPKAEAVALAKKLPREAIVYFFDGADSRNAVIKLQKS